MCLLFYTTYDSTLHRVVISFREIGWKPASPPELSPDGFRRETWEESLCLFRRQRRPFLFFCTKTCGFLWIVFSNVSDFEKVERFCERISLTFRQPPWQRKQICKACSDLLDLFTIGGDTSVRSDSVWIFSPPSFVFFFTDGNLRRLNSVSLPSLDRLTPTKSGLEMSLTLVGSADRYFIPFPPFLSKKKAIWQNWQTGGLPLTHVQSAISRRAWGGDVKSSKYFVYNSQ